MSKNETKKTQTFAELGLSRELLAAVEAQGYTSPTPVQAQAIPAGLEGRDVLACAATGSGKTAAFLLPVIERLKEKPRGTTRALVLTPTRELAAQVEEQRALLAGRTGVSGAAVFGGVGMSPQVEAFRKGVDILVATPGRLLDHFQYDYAALAGVEILILDEADRMLDMGFLPAIRRVLRHLPKGKRQTLLFSATMPAPIVELARELQREPVRVDVERKQAPAKGVFQALYPVPQTAKVALLAELLRRDEVGNAIVFCRTKHRANRLAQKLEKMGFPVARIHGNRSQAQRTDALEGFKEGRYRILAATDIVARGIDVEALEHVVNFDVPVAPEDYIHRVGRTGRAEATGDAYTFVAPDEEELITRIERQVGRKIERRTLEGFDYRAKAEEPLEIPLKDRIAQIRAQKAEERARAKANAERRAQRQAEEEARQREKEERQRARASGAAQPKAAGQPEGEGSGKKRRRRRRGGRGRRPAGASASRD